MKNSNAIVLREDTDDEDLLCMQSNYRVQASVLRAMQTCDKFCDVSLFGVPPSSIQASALCPIRAHKAVLAQASRYFYELFTNEDYIDSNQAENHIENVEHDNLRLIVDFVYTDKLKTTKQDAIDVLRGVLTGAKYLLMTDLADVCEKYLAGDSQIKLDNCISLWCFARKYSCLTLMHATSTFIAENLADMPKNVEFLTMPYADCAKLLLSEAFVAADADDRCVAAIAWLDHDVTESRASYVHDVWNMIPLTPGSVSTRTIRGACESEFLWNHAPKLVRSLMAGELLRREQNELAVVVDLATNSNRSPVIGSWYVIGGRLAPTLFLSYNISQRLWTRLPPVPASLSSTGVCAVGNQLVVMGGRSDDENSVRKYDLEPPEMWLRESGRPAVKLRQRRRYGLAACSDGRYAYAIGGFGRNDSIKAIERYNPQTNEIVRMSNLSSPRYRHATVFSSAHDSIFVVAGLQNPWEYVTSIEKYDIPRDMCLPAGRLPTGRYGAAAALSGDDLFVIGGCGYNGVVHDCVEVFNVRTRQVRVAPKLLQPRHGCYATTIHNGNVICLLGGSRKLQTFDVREGKWSCSGNIVKDMPEVVRYFGFAAV